ncbi:MAG: hypothetical protein LUI87_19570 [Lachnospiraceae bacterium]|nr:hypothetical protein [Lachnospiraceae bacterium]
MTNLEFEEMAIHTVQHFPVPETSFEEIRRKQKLRTQHVTVCTSGKRKRVLAAVLAAALVILSGLSVYAGQSGNGMWAFYRASSTYLGRFDYNLPENLATASMSEETQWLKIVPMGFPGGRHYQIHYIP